MQAGRAMVSDAAFWDGGDDLAAMGAGKAAIFIPPRHY